MGRALFKKGSPAIFFAQVNRCLAGRSYFPLFFAFLMTASPIFQ